MQTFFLLGFVTDPDVVLQRGREVGIKSAFACEMVAWCAEIHAQLHALAATEQVELVLMGGNGASALT